MLLQLVIALSKMGARSLKIKASPHDIAGRDRLSQRFINPYRYGFNGKEKDDEISGNGNEYDFGSRMYDPRLGKWLSVDPEFKRYPHLSPYSAFADNPMYYIDPGGETLRVSFANEGERKRVEAALQKLTNDKVVVTQTGLVKLISGNQNPKKNLVKGTQLLRDVSDHEKTATLYIDAKSMGAGVSYRVPKAAENGTGTDVDIRISNNLGTEQAKINGKTVSVKKDEATVIGSELIHSLVAMDGYSIPETVKGTNTDTTTVYSRRRKQRLNLYNKINAPTYGSK